MSKEKMMKEEKGREKKKTQEKERIKKEEEERDTRELSLFISAISQISFLSLEVY